MRSSITIGGSNSLLISETGVDIFASGDLDDYFQFSVTSNRPLLTAIGNYLVLGKDATSGHSLDADDVLFGEDVEVDGTLFADGIVQVHNGDADDYITLSVVSNIPTIYGTGAYLRIGDAAATNRGLAFEDDLMVTGKLEVEGLSWFESAATINGINLTGSLVANDNTDIGLGASTDCRIRYQTVDTDARMLVFMIDESDDSGDNVPAFAFGEETNLLSADLNLFDEVVQPHIATVHNDGKRFSSSSCTSDDGGATTELLCTGVGTGAVIGDIVRVTGGTNATPGWYFIDGIDSADDITLDRNWCTGDVSNGVISCWRKVSMMTPMAVYMPIYDAAPDDNDIDIPLDGAMALDCSQANGRLYWRANSVWHYVDATG